MPLQIKLDGNKMTSVDFSALGWRDAADVALQRTHHLLAFPHLGPLAFRAWRRDMPWVLYMEAMLRKRSILRGAMADAEREFDQIRQYLGNRTVARSVDIGCGHALIDLPIHRHFGCHVHLVDIEETPTRHHEWRDQGAGYASLESARRFLEANGIRAECISTTNPRKAPLTDDNCDLITSLFSAGFHYPVFDYAQFALRALRPGGVFIFDARKGQDQEAALAAFSKVDTIEEAAKHTRLAAVR